VSVADPLMPEIVAVTVPVPLVVTFFPFTDVVAAEFAPVEVTLDDGDTVTWPKAVHETVRP